jgi:hypothetical protein
VGDKSKIYLSKEKVIEWVTLTALVLFYVSDAINKYLKHIDFGYERVSVITRAFYELLFIGLIILFVNRKKLEGILGLVIFTATFLLSIGLYFVFIDSKINIPEHIIVFNKYIYVFIIFFAIYEINKYPSAQKRVTKLLENIFLLNALLAISGAIFDFPLFKTYLGVDYGCGYDGVFVAQNEATFYCFLSLTYFYHLWQFKSGPIWKFLVVLVSCIILGTKGYYIYLVFIAVYHMYAHPNKIRNWTIIGGGLLTTILYVVINFDQFDFYAHHLKKYGLLTMALSGRDELFRENFMSEIWKWSPIQYLIGGHDRVAHMIEMDLFDMFLSFGFFGSALFLFLYFKTIFNFNYRYHFLIFFVCSYYFLAGLGGHFFASAVNSLNVVLVCLSFQHYYDQLSDSKLVEKTESA